VKDLPALFGDLHDWLAQNTKRRAGKNVYDVANEIGGWKLTSFKVLRGTRGEACEMRRC
jgi:hypothetical protein